MGSERSIRIAVPQHRLSVGVVIEAEHAALSRGEQPTGSIGSVDVRHDDIDSPESVEREPVSISQGLTPQFACNAGGGQERADLLRLNLAIGGEYASPVIHVSAAGDSRKTEAYATVLGWIGMTRQRM